MTVLGGLAAFFIYKRRQERQHANDLNLRKLVELTGASSAEGPLIAMLVRIKEFTGAHRAYIYMFDSHQETLHAIGEKADLRALTRYEYVSIANSKYLELIHGTRSIIIDEDYLHPPRPDVIIDPNIIQEGNLCSICIPIVAENEVLGMLPLIYNHYRTWDKEDIGLCLSIGRIVGAAVQVQTRLKEEKELSTLRERRRISQELHDSFSQLISALGMRSEAAMITLEDGDFSKIETDLSRIIETTHEIRSILRDEMLSLRNIAEEQKDLLPAIRTCVERFKTLSNIPVELLDQDAESPLIVSSYTGNQFIWILQECLSNVRRHSNAGRVVVTVAKTAYHLSLKVEDDGQGFDQASVPENRLGLQIICERAQDVGGRIAIHSAIDQGTCIEVVLPIISLKNEDDDGT